MRDDSLVLPLCVGVVVGFDPDTYSVTEGGVVTFEIVRSGQSSVPVSVDFSTEDGTANGK